MSPMLFLLLMMFMFCISGLMLHRTHFLSALLCLEGMMLTLFLLLTLWSDHLNVMSFFMTSMFLLTFSACEASSGLALMVATTRTHGTDHLKNLNLLQC
uniref:NADH-ubiquinone oxidoreductase chain 4L n=1 Tax=Dicamptodon aterrimus TaxID=294758 RepID=C9DHE2_DICAT|nr:NADH dehydrogenase subunit 4L [Dicamptodon aterrimus]